MTIATPANVRTAIEAGPDLAFLANHAAAFLAENYGGINEAIAALEEDYQVGLAGAMDAQDAWTNMADKALSNPQGLANILNDAQQ